MLPGPAPKENDKFPPNKTYYEIPIAVQDRAFNDDGSLFFPDTRAFFDEFGLRNNATIDGNNLFQPRFIGQIVRSHIARDRGQSSLDSSILDLPRIGDAEARRCCFVPTTRRTA